ncbi:permease [Croceibacterium mercuriale]|uniref:Permease n=1 Tax=Croceibacterium mercuriale TaxID=1572751 RepID=A0A0B2C405_9SPHN|nr:permease [Croceibacterium mercuriale]
MSPLGADIVGLLGSALFIAAFAYANMVKVIDKVLFNAVNLIGAALLLTSLSVNFNLAAFVLEAAWTLIAAISLVSALLARRTVEVQP